VNRPIKKVGVFCLMLLAVLFLAGNYIQFANAGSYWRTRTTGAT
jgi:hypothetical protein